jgi:hypothetical protein
MGWQKGVDKGKICFLSLVTKKFHKVWTFLIQSSFGILGYTSILSQSTTTWQDCNDTPNHIMKDCH